MPDTQTFDLRDVEFLDEAQTHAVLAARRSGPVTLLLTPGTQPAQKLARLLHGLLREARPGVWRLG